MALNPGDIAFVQYNADNNDNFAFVSLVTIPAGEVILFTDNGWLNTNAFRTGEGIITWTAPAGGVTAGTVVTINTVPSATAGAVAETGDLNFAAAGDQIIAFQGSLGSPTAIAALNNDGSSVFQSDAADSNTSALPLGLVIGTSALAIAEIDNARYTGITTGDRATLQAALFNPANWAGDDATNQTFSGTFTLGGGGVTPTVSIAATANAAEASTVNGSFRISRTGDPTTALNVNYSVDTGTGQATPGTDYTSLAGIATIGAGSLFVDVIVAPVDDAIVEGNEAVTLTLSPSASFTLGTATASVTIVDNDSVAPSTTKISTIQGAGTAATAGTFTIEGIVVGDFQGTGQLGGFYLQEENTDADGNPRLMSATKYASRGQLPKMR
jgi:hypothetical protein